MPVRVLEVFHTMKNIEDIISANEKKILALIFIVALALRLIAVMNLPSRYQIPVADAGQYDDLAINLLAGEGFVDSNTGLPTSWRVPLYPLFLAGIYSIFGHNYAAVRIIQCIMGALLCLVIFYIGKMLFDRKIALLSAAILASYQPFIFHLYWGGPAFLLSENLFTFLLALLVFSLIRNLFVQFSLKNCVIAGILIGLLTLTRPVIALFPLFLFGLLLYKNKYSFIFTLKKTLPLLVSFILVILPWTVRNYFIHKAFVPFSTQGGFVLLACNNPYAKGSGLVDVESLLTEEEKNQLSKMSEVEIDNMYRKHAKEFSFKNYKKLPRLYFKKLLGLWDIYTTDWDPDGSCRRRYNIWYSIVLMFASFGIVKSVKSKLNINISLLILLFLYLSIIAMIFCGSPRFRNPIEPYLIIFASVGIFKIYNGFANKFLSCTIIGFVIAINFLFYAKADLILNYARHVLNAAF